MIVETLLTHQKDPKTRFGESMKANFTHTSTGRALKMHFSNIWGPYTIKFWHIPYLKSHSTYEIS